MTYIELPSDHAFTAFLAHLTPGKVLRDRERMFTPAERKRQRYLREKAHTEGLRSSGRQFTQKEIEIAVRAMEARSK